MTMNYTFLGTTEMMEYQGVWVDVNMTVFTDIHDTSTTNYSANITIFVAITDNPPDAGLDGTLGVSVTPIEETWLEVSILS